MKNKLLKFIFGVEVKDGQNTFKEIIKVLIETALIVLTIHTFLYKPFNIPSGSMVPTLLIGDYLFVSKFKYGYSNHSLPFSPDLFKGRVFESKPEYGDVAVFRPPHNTSEDWVKRIIGLPGDKIQMIEGRLHINGQKLEITPAGKLDWKDQHTNDFSSDVYIETLPNGRKHKLIKTFPFGEARKDNTAIFTVPEGHYFMVGDNRDFSWDSRFIEDIGFIPYDNLVGEAQIIFFSTDLPTIDSSWWQVWNWPTSTRYSRSLNLIK